VIKTGQQTFVGRAANLIASTVDAGHFQKVVGRIGNFLVAITLFMIVIILIIQTAAQG
jgi:magnesium-transporting ATPase (P-type)